MQRSHRGEDLAQADFSGRDVRGFDFTGAILSGADFRSASLGVRPALGLVVLGGAILLSVMAGLAIGWSVDDMADRFASGEWDQVAEGGSIGLILVALVAVMIWKGIDTAYLVVLGLYVAVVAVNIVANLAWDVVEWEALVRATFTVVLLTLAVAAGALGRVIGGHFGAWAIAAVSLLGGIASGRVNGGLAGLVVALALVFISKRALTGDARDRRLIAVGRAFVRRFGTRFVGADLRDADFRGTTMRGSDFRRAVIAGAQWGEQGPPIV